MSNMYAAIGVWNICCEYILCEIDKTRVKLFKMGISSFIHVYVWSSLCLVQNHMGSVRNVYLTIRIWSCDRAIST